MAKIEPCRGAAAGLVITIIVIAVIGLAFAAGGLWLALLGGSIYYLIAGAALLGCALLLWRRSGWALSLYALILLATLAWAVAEIGLDWWRLVPRGDVLFVVGLLLLAPWVRDRLRDPGADRPPLLRRPWVHLAAALVVAAIVGVLAITSESKAEWAGRLPGPRAPLVNAGAPGDWQAYGHNLAGDKFSPVTQLTPANVGKLEKVWEYHTGDLKGPSDPAEFTYEVTPLKVGDLVYLCSPHNHVYALDAETGALRWRFDPQIKVSDPQHLTCRGVSYHDGRAPGSLAASADCSQRLFLATNDARLIALDALSGRRCAGFGVNGEIDTRHRVSTGPPEWYQFTSAPLVTNKLVILGGAIFDNRSVGMPSGVIRAFDVDSGKLVWNFDPGNPTSTAPIPPDGHYVPSTPNSWSTSAADEALGLLYVPMGNGAVDQWGGNRSPMTERYSATILALDIATGQERWRFQTVHHDLWDMDVPAQPALVDLDIAGRGRVPALVQSTKTGNIFILDRRTGQPLLPVTERPVPGGPAAGDHLSPTQPFSMASFLPTDPIEERDMWGATPFDQLACRIGFRKLRYDGPFTPPSEQGSIVFPGNFGVMDWGGMAIDPVRQIAFAHPNYMAFVDKLVAQRNGGSPGSDKAGYNPNAGAPFAALINPFLSGLGLPCQAPPWGYVAGMDLTTGKVAWRWKNGTVRDETPLPLPFELGVPSLGGPMMTAGGVAFLSSALDNYVRAYDVETGKTLWRARLPAGGQATPMSYWSKASGRQFVVVVAGGHGTLGTDPGDSVIAYALPRGAGRPAAS